MEQSVSNKELISKFYTAFANEDAESMVACYHDEMTFEDPAFGLLSAKEAGSMWHMLLERAKGNIDIKFKDVSASETKGSAYWIATYPFGAKKRIVENHIKAKFEFKDGKISKHEDSFDVWKWSRMAMGLPGALLGWTPFIQNKIKSTALSGLKKYMAEK